MRIKKGTTDLYIFVNQEALHKHSKVLRFLRCPSILTEAAHGKAGWAKSGTAQTDTGQSWPGPAHFFLNRPLQRHLSITLCTTSTRNVGNRSISKAVVTAIPPLQTPD